MKIGLLWRDPTGVRSLVSADLRSFHFPRVCLYGQREYVDESAKDSAIIGQLRPVEASHWLEKQAAWFFPTAAWPWGPGLQPIPLPSQPESGTENTHTLCWTILHQKEANLEELPAK